MLPKSLLNAGSVTGHLLNEYNCFHWHTGDEWRVSKGDRPWVTDDEYSSHNRNLQI